jgi:hypothetical protein
VALDPRAEKAVNFFVPRHEQCDLATVDDGPIAAFIRDNLDRVAFVDHPEAADRIVLFEEWGARFPDYIATLERDYLVREHWRKLVTVNCDDLGRGFLPGLYTSLTPRNFEPALHRACAYPYIYNRVEDYAGDGVRSASGKYLFSFTGSLRTHSIRRRLHELYGETSAALVRAADIAFHAHTEADKRQYVEDILDSRFVLCPRGWSPSSYRLFEAMQLGRCPVIISDAWIPIEGVDWARCAIRIAEANVGAVAEVLRGRAAEAEALGRAARRAWEAHFAPEQKFRFMFDQLAPVFETADGADYRKRWRTMAFYRANGWALHQRGLRLLTRLGGRLRASR